MEEITWTVFIHMKELGILINHKLNICQDYDVSAEINQPKLWLHEGKWGGDHRQPWSSCSGLWSDHTEVLGSVVGTTILGGY